MSVKAAIIAVGSELLTSTRTDTNSLTITEVLNGLGIDVAYKVIVGDDRAELRAQFVQAFERTDLVLLTGGLGPTDDDLTREVVAEALDLPLEEDASVLAFIQQRFANRGWKMPEVNRRQAQVPRGALVLANPNGTAPGLWIERDGKGVALLPGPPREMRPMLQLLAAERFVSRSGGLRLHRRVLKIGGRGESRVEELVQPIYSQWLHLPRPIETTILATPGQIELHLTMRDNDAASANAALDRAVAQIDAVLGPDIFSTDGRQIEAVLGEMLASRGWRIALGESCTGGLATSRLTDVAGSSAYVEMSVVAYSNVAKIDLLGVPAALIEAHGAVSEPVAAAMAEGACRRAGVEVGVGITGIAGPTGGTEQKPVGTVCIAVTQMTPATQQPNPPHQPAQVQTHVRTFRFLGGREMVKVFASFAALDMVRRVLNGTSTDVDWIKRP
jgi:nicotinamide-nucleotide amidase